MKQRAAAAACPCGGALYQNCCGRYHQGETPASAVLLMRSRYSAYVLRLDRYLLDTWHPSTRPARLALEDAGTTRWLGLDIRAQQTTGDAARVEFFARYRSGEGPVQQQHEVSRFVREQGRWFYLAGEFPAPPTSFVERRKYPRY